MTATAEQGAFVDIQVGTGATVRVEPVTPHIFRVRMDPAGDFPEPGLVRYGMIRGDWDPVEWSLEEDDARVMLRTAGAALTVDRDQGRVELRSALDQILLRQVEAPVAEEKSGFRAAFALAPEARLYGLGDHTRERIEKRGELARMWVRNVACYVPIPVVLSDSGWGLFVNSTWRHYVDLGHTRRDRLAFGGRRGGLDYYLIAGADLPTLLDRYTQITGRPSLLPLWGYGLTFVCNQQADAREMLDDCLNFRREEIPCDLVGLEPGWMSTHYDFSVDKAWHPERFYLPHWAPKGPHTFLGAAQLLGFKMSLWLCCDYDLSAEEERRLSAERTEEDLPEGAGPSDAGNAIHPDDFEKDEHFGHPRMLMDKLTRPDQAWFEHLEPFVDQGVSAFKMDGANQVNEHPDRKWANGMDDEEMHNLYPVLLNKQMSLGFENQTNRRAMVYSSGGYAGIQRYAATWAGDTGGGPKPLISILNHGLSGHVNASCDMDVFSPAGIHFGFLQPWSQVCSWAYWRHPWLLGDELGPLFRRYARLRYRLLPYIYSAAHTAARTGLPILRAMPLAFPDDPRSDELVHQYMFGDAFLTGAFIDSIYLPAGRWIDYWTGVEYAGEQELPCTFPPEWAGPLFVRAGALIPEWPPMQYVGQKPVDHLALDVYPQTEGEFVLYEDDGVSNAYRDGAVAVTRLRCLRDGGSVTVEIGPRKGEYEGMPERRSYAVRLHVPASPASVNGTEEEDPAWEYADGLLRVRMSEAPGRIRPVRVVCTW